MSHPKASVNTKQRPTKANKKKVKNAVRTKQIQRPLRRGTDAPMPPRPWRTETQANNAADKINHMIGGRGVDPRSAVREDVTVKSQAIQMNGVISNLKVICQIQDRAIASLATGIILTAIRHGLLAAQTGTPLPYYCWRYLIDSFTSCLKGVIPTISNAPTWFWDICYAIRTKSASFKTGQVSYEWEIQETGAGTDQVFPLGSSTDYYAIFWGTTLSGSTVEGFPVLSADAPYTPDLGASVIQSVFETLRTPFPQMKMHGDPAGASIMINDTSAFSVVFPELGTSYFTQGALRSTMYSERQIDSPLFAKFALYQPPGTAEWRGWHKAGVTAGSPCYIGPRMMEVSTVDQVRNKTPMTLKYFNFDEFFEVLSLSLCLAIEARQVQLPKACPLTSQQVQILLRQAMIPFFCNHMAQDVYLNGVQFVDFLPFTVGPNGSSSTVPMTVPTFLGENIRACGRLTSDLHTTRSTLHRTTLDYVPILGRPVESSTPPLSQYQYVVGTNPPADLYASVPGEIPVNLVDCSATVSGNTVYLDLNRDSIQVMAATWNAWISELQEVLTPLVNLGGAERGIRALNVNIYTNHDQKLSPPDVPPVVVPTNTVAQTAVLVDKKAIKKATSVKHFHLGLGIKHLKANVGAAPSPGTSYFTTTVDKDVTTSLPFQPTLWGIIGRWILPVSFTVAELEDGSLQGWQSFEMEPYRFPRSSAGGVGGGQDSILNWPHASSRHLMMASCDVKTDFSGGSQNEIITQLIELSKQGRGGFFSSVAKVIGGGLDLITGGL